MIDDLATFAARLPSWVGSDGFPLTYRHFRYGMDWINRDEVRRMLRDAASARFSQAPKDDYIRERRHLLRSVGDGR